MPRVSGVGGMVSFRGKLAAGLARRGIETCDDLADMPYQAVLVIGGTRQLGALWRARQSGARLVQRLDGMNWLHRLEGGARLGVRHFIRAEYGNLLLSFIRTRLASRIVYQSRFAHGWWGRVHGPAPVPATVIYNGVDLDVYAPHGKGSPPKDGWRVLMVEGSLMGGYEQGLQAAVGLLEGLATGLSGAYSRYKQKPVELLIVGRVESALQKHWSEYVRQSEWAERGRLTWAGLLPHSQIPETDRSAHLLYSSDVNAACPNSVIEALACGLPVLAFDTGALPELVTGDAGRIVPYGGDPWQLEPPDVKALAGGASEILADQERFADGARQRAEAAFGLDQMVEAYIEVLSGR
jgi:glycosyltransferase involved in cell wall biosynthesis